MKKLFIALAAVTIAAAAAIAPATAAPRSGKTVESIKIAQSLRCVAVAKRGRGRGLRVRGTRNERFGPRACKRARRACVRDLRARQRRGLNPRAACVVVRRGRRG